MKTLGYLLFVMVLVSSEATDKDEWSQKIQKHRQECVKETGVDDALITKADLGEFSDTRALKCFAKCFYQKLGFLSENGDLLLDAVKANMPNNEYQAQSLAILDLCKNSQGSDACETAYALHKCYYMHAQEVIKIEKEKQSDDEKQ